jgi:hypothetical protein
MKPRAEITLIRESILLENVVTARHRGTGEAIIDKKVTEVK